MILKASQRGGGQDLAIHLLKPENEHVQLHELRGFACDDLRGAFKEVDAISRGTKCRQYLFSLSLNPPEGAQLTVGAFEAAIERIEQRLCLSGRPRAIVFHEKEGRRHAHCVWSCIDAKTMTARPLSFFKNKLMEVSRDLYLQHGWQMPKGLSSPLDRDPTNFSLAEWQQVKRMGQDPRWLKSLLQAAWKASNNGKAFVRALEEHGLFLARGDKRSFVVLDHTGEVHSPPRALGLKTKDVAARLGTGNDLSSVADTKAAIGSRMVPAIHRHIEDAKARFRERSMKLSADKEALTNMQREARNELETRLDAEWRSEREERVSRLPKGLRGLWSRVTGRYQEQKTQAERQAAQTRERHAAEWQSLIESQLEQRGRLQLLVKDLRGMQAEQLVTLRREVGHFFALASGEEIRGVFEQVQLQCGSRLSFTF